MARGAPRGSGLEPDAGRAPGEALADDGSEPGGPVPPRPYWTRLHLWEIQGVRDVLVVMAIFGLLWLGYKLSIVTVPILLAMALAYLFEPVVQWLIKPRGKGTGMSREAAASIIIGAAVLLVVVPLSIGVVVGVAQGIQVVGRVAEAAGHVNTIMVAQNRLGSPFNEAGQFDRFEPPAPEPAEGPIEEPQDGAADESGEEAGAPPAGPDQEAALEQAGPGGSASEQPERRRDGQARPREPKLTDVQLAANANNAWVALDRNFPGLQGALAWVLRRMGDEQADSGVAQVVQWGVEQLQTNTQVIAQQALGGGVVAAQAVISRIISFGMFLFMLFLTAFFFYFFSTGYGRVLDFWRGLIPEARKHRVFDLARQMDRVIAGFIRGRLTIAALQAVFFTIAYWLIGVPAPLIIGPLVAILSIVPYVALIGVPITIIMMLLDAPSGFQSEWWWTLGAPAAVYFAGQALDDYVFTPLIQGKSTDMATPSILFASIAGGALAGLYGLLLAIPVAACLKILMREVFWPRFRQWAEGRQRDFLPISGGETQ